jgi:hypothetical protein
MEFLNSAHLNSTKLSFDMAQIGIDRIMTAFEKELLLKVVL